MVKPFLSIATRTCSREQFLMENIQSVKSQTCQDIEQVFIVDRKKKGIQAADRALGENKHRMKGRYSFILDDDCWLISDTFVERAKKFIEENNFPTLIMFRSKRPPGKPSYQPVFPTKEVWGKTPLHGTTNCLCYMVEASVWKQWIEYFGIKPHGGDFWFLKAILDAGHKPHWLDTEPLAESRQLGRGKLFESVQKRWFEKVAKQEELVNLGNDDWRLRLFLEKEKNGKRD